MGNIRLSQPACVDWLDEGPLAPYVNAFNQYLTAGGYAKTSFANCLGSIAHFSQWVHRRSVDVRRIDEAIVGEFLDGHLPSCRCSGVAQRHRPTLSAALGHLLFVWWEVGRRAACQHQGIAGVVERRA